MSSIKFEVSVVFTFPVNILAFSFVVNLELVDNFTHYGWITLLDSEGTLGEDVNHLVIVFLPILGEGH
jgi:hypothetical protein